MLVCALGSTQTHTQTHTDTHRHTDTDTDTDTDTHTPVLLCLAPHGAACQSVHWQCAQCQHTRGSEAWGRCRAWLAAQTTQPAQPTTKEEEEEEEGTVPWCKQDRTGHVRSTHSITRKRYTNLQVGVGARRCPSSLPAKRGNAAESVVACAKPLPLPWRSHSAVLVAWPGEPSTATRPQVRCTCVA